MHCNPLHYSTGFTVIESRLLESTKVVLLKEEKKIVVGNIYPFLFIGCGKVNTLEECVEFGLKYAMDIVNKHLNKQSITNL